MVANRPDTRMHTHGFPCAPLPRQKTHRQRGAAAARGRDTVRRQARGGGRRNGRVSGGKQENGRPGGKGREMCKHTEPKDFRLCLLLSVAYSMFGS